MKYHDAVMPDQCIEGLGIWPDGIYVDVTFGGGGHARRILERMGAGEGKVVAFDQDEDAAVNAINDNRFILIRDNFRNMQEHLQQKSLVPVNGILADLGVSSHQFDEPSRGFSIRFEHDLDMRMDTSSGKTALELLNTLQEKELVRIFSSYGEVKNSKTLAAAIVNARMHSPLSGSGDFRKAIGHLVPKANESQYLAQVYQALRIEVNQELDALKALLNQCVNVLVPGGKLVVMSYHSLEDRLVKNFIAKGNFEGSDEKDLYGNNTGIKFRSLTKKPMVPSEKEVKNNPRSRSAKLRIAEKL
ncbi:MAG: 16S rRNA (cytosine(1402)-N(4))-methyltransferase RsmH [Bacteroidota bacterium]|nr:16S rRNA (cytosine(1402)-N(4))-methyltransferase RsmH [Bacteroidota bacterium]